MRRLFASVCVFSGATLAVAGGPDFGWELLKPEQKKKILDEYNAYLQPGKDGKPHAKFKDAAKLMGKRDAKLEYVVPVLFMWSNIEKKKSSEASASCRNAMLVIVMERGNLTRSDDAIAKFPDRMIDEYLWLLKQQTKSNSRPQTYLDRIADFGPRASRVSDDIRTWFFETKGAGGAVADGYVRMILERIEKK
jgi:hypothetical protein